jgi:hypothetical protein
MGEPGLRLMTQFSEINSMYFRLFGMASQVENKRKLAKIR